MIQARNTKMVAKNTISYWQQINQEWEKTQEPQKQFCKKHGITYGKFTYWRNKIVQNKITNGINHPPVFKEVKIAKPVLSTNTQPIIKISLPNDIVISIPVNVNDKLLTTLIQSFCGGNNA